MVYYLSMRKWEDSMKITNLGGYPSIDSFVDAKLGRCNSSDRSFESLFELMFSESSNVLWEESKGYRVSKTTYAQAREHILSRASRLRELMPDAKSSSVVGLYMDNSLDWIEVFWAILRAGFSPLLLNLRLDDDTLEYALRVTDAAAVVSDGKRFSVKTIPAEKLTADAPGIDTKEFGTAVMVMSSGTSSHVKICGYTAEEFCCQIQGSYGIIKQCARIKKHYEGELKLLTFLPFYHIFGLVAVYIWFAFFSRTFVRLNDMQPQTILNTIKRHKVTHIFAVPLFWEKVYEQAMRTISERGEKTVKKFEKGMKAVGFVLEEGVQGSPRRNVRRERAVHDHGRQLHQSAGARVLQRDRLPPRGRLRHERDWHNLRRAQRQAQPAQLMLGRNADDGHGV